MVKEPEPDAVWCYKTADEVTIQFCHSYWPCDGRECTYSKNTIINQTIYSY
jgi:hypothetical protein